MTVHSSPKPHGTPATPATALGLVQSVNLDALPDSHLLAPPEAGTAIGVEASTLSVWRSTGRYNLPFVKSGRKVYYRVGDLKAFLQRRTATHTGNMGMGA
jgi:hypothetical protein